MMQQDLNFERASQQRITRAYFVRHKGYALSGMAAGFFLSVWLVNVPSARHSVGIYIGLFMFLMNVTFAGRTAQGNGWRGACLILIAAVAGSVYWGLYSPVGIVCVMAAVVGGGAAVCLRWNVPTVQQKPVS